MKMFVECCKSKDKDSTYQVLTVDLGYRVCKLFEVPKDVISEIADIKISEIYKMQAGDKMLIGELIVKPQPTTK